MNIRLSMRYLQYGHDLRKHARASYGSCACGSAEWAIEDGEQNSEEDISRVTWME